MRSHGKGSSAPLDVRLAGNILLEESRNVEEVTSLVRLLANDPRVGFEGLKPHAVTMEALTGGRSTAKVFKLTPLLDSNCRIKGSPVVIKIAPSLQGLCEKENYETFVRNGLPAHSRPELLLCHGSRNYQCLVYSFLGDPDGTPADTLSNYLQRGDMPHLDLALRLISDVIGETWYSAKSLQLEDDIAKRYLNRYFTNEFSSTTATSSLRECAARYFSARNEAAHCVIDGKLFPSPHQVLFETDQKRAFYSCILHGDLNSDNIVITPKQNRVAMVDFQRTGRGHVYEDFVALEASIRINCPSDASIGEIVETEKQIAMGRPQVREEAYATPIHKIRSVAFRQFGHLEDVATYHFAVASIGLRLMRATDLSHVSRARITASALWATKALADELAI